MKKLIAKLFSFFSRTKEAKLYVTNIPEPMLEFCRALFREDDRFVFTHLRLAGKGMKEIFGIMDSKTGVYFEVQRVYFRSGSSTSLYIQDPRQEVCHDLLCMTGFMDEDTHSLLCSQIESRCLLEPNTSSIGRSRYLSNAEKGFLDSLPERFALDYARS